MDKSASHQSIRAPFPGISLDAKGSPDSGKHLLQAKPPSLVQNFSQKWASCLSSPPDNLRHPGELFVPPVPGQPPIFKTVGMLLGTWDPGKHPRIVVRGKHPMQPGKQPVGAVLALPPPPGPRPPGAGETFTLFQTDTGDVGREHPMQPEERTVGVCLAPPPPPGPRPPGAGETFASYPADTGEIAGQHPMRPENAASISPLRNGNRQGNPNAAPRCGALTRLGCPCRGPAMSNGRCRMHGGGSTGAKTPAGRARIVAARTIHGGYGAEARAFQAHVSALLRRGRVMCAFAKADLAFAVVTPLIHQAQAMEPNPGSASSKANTPCNQRKCPSRSARRAAQTSETTEAMLALMTLDLSARQASVLTHLIRDAGRAAQVRPRQPSGRTKTLRGEQPMHPEKGAGILAQRATQGARPALVPPGPPTQTPVPTTLSGSTPYNLKPNRATRRKMAAQARQATCHGGRKR